MVAECHKIHELGCEVNAKRKEKGVHGMKDKGSWLEEVDKKQTECHREKLRKEEKSLKTKMLNPI